MSSRISQRIRRRRNQCRWAKARSTTQRWVPRPDPCSVPSGNHWFHAEFAAETAVPVVVVAAVTKHDVGAAPRSAALAPYGRHCFE